MFDYPAASQPTRLALAGDGATVLLLSDELPSPGLTKANITVLALDASGSRRWSTAFDATLAYDRSQGAAYGLFVDGGGTVVVTVGAITGLDLASRAVLWTLQPPDPKQCLRPSVLGAGGSLVASQCDGTIFLVSRLTVAPCGPRHPREATVPARAPAALPLASREGAVVASLLRVWMQRGSEQWLRTTQATIAAALRLSELVLAASLARRSRQGRPRRLARKVPS